MAEPVPSGADGEPGGDRDGASDAGAESSAAGSDGSATVGSDASLRPGGDVPGPDGLPLAGNTIEFLRDPLAFYERCGAYDSDIVRYAIGGDTGFMLTDPADIERVLVTDDAHFGRASLTQDTLGQIADGGLFLLEGDEWQRHRTALQPSFYRERIETYADMMARFADERADEWAGGLATGHSTVAVSAEMRSLTLEILAKTLLDVDIRERESAIRDAAGVISERFDAGSLSAYLPLWVPTPANRRCKRAVAAFDEAIAEMVAQRRASDGEFDDLLSILLSLDLGDGTDGDTTSLSETEIRDHLFTFLFAGHETTALTLSYATFLLATNPEKQARLHDELDAALDGRPGATDLFELDYLDNVVDEALRLYPPAYTVFREPTRDVAFQGYRVPEGSLVSLPQWVVHRDERWFADPDSFRPERWADEGADGDESGAADTDAGRPEYAYFPFGGGSRHCIGMRFALMETKLVLATLARRFRFETVTEPPLDLSMQITLQPTDPIEVGLAAR